MHQNGGYEYQKGGRSIPQCPLLNHVEPCLKSLLNVHFWACSIDL